MTDSNNIQKIHNAFLELGADISTDSCSKLYSYYQLLIEKNKVMNLTAITEFDDVISKHFIDSVIPFAVENVSRETFPDISVSEILCSLRAKHVSRETCEIGCGTANIVSRETSLSMIDVGTGAGLPGIPLKICFPELSVTLLDSLGKRVRFLDEVIDSLKLENITAIHSRAEDACNIKTGEHREKYDICVSRAVADLAVLCEYCLPFVRTGGFFFAYKARDIEPEIERATKAVKVLGGSIKGIQKIKMSEGDVERNIIIIEKTGKTPAAYPRKAGTPVKEPIK